MTSSDRASQQPGTTRPAELLHTTYTCDAFQRLLLADPSQPHLPSMQLDGTGVTVAMLSHDLSATKTLLSSLHRHCGFLKGALILAGFFDSRPPHLPTLPHARTVRVLEFSEKQTTVSARNELIRAATTDWILLLDDRLICQENPFHGLRRCITTLGCHFAALAPAPLETAPPRTGHLRIRLTHGQTCVSAEHVPVSVPPSSQPPGWLCTHMDGRAACLFRPTLEHVGLYDEELTPDLADLDLSIRIFRSGLKIGQVAGQPLRWQPDISPADENIPPDILRRATLHFEQKHALKLTDSERQPPTTPPPSEFVPTQPHPRIAASPTRDRPRIALIIDRENWAFANIARQVRRYVGDQFDFETIPVAIVDSMLQVLLLTQHCDLVHLFWRELPQLILSDWMRHSIAARGGNYERFMQRYVRSKALSVSIYDHLHLTPAALAERQPIYAELLDGYYVGSERLRRIYEQIPDYPPPAAVLQDGVDLGLFYPQNLDRLADVPHRELVIGWVGNSEWNLEIDDFKGVRTILRPAIAQLRAEGLPVREHFADRAAGTVIAHQDMVNYYSQIDLYVCTSKIEGTPNPVLESMACGVPIITTDVGIVPEAFGPQQRQYILAERSVPCLKEAIRTLLAHPQQFRRLSTENLEQIRTWDWSVRARGFADFFRTCLQRRDARLAKAADSACQPAHPD